MSNIQSRFNFIGEALLPKADSKRPFFKTMTKNKKEMASLNFGLKESDSNMAFVEAFDSVQDTIITMDTDNNKIEIKWADRFSEDVLKAVANYKKYTVDLGEDFGGRQDFVTQYDAILHLKEYLPKYKGKVIINGQFVKELYKGQYYDKFKLQNVYAADDGLKNRLSLTIDIFYNKNSIDKVDFKTENKIYINGYISQYISKTEKNKYMPHQFIFNTAKYNIEENERHKALFDYKMKYIDVKNKTMVHIPWEIILIRGAEGVEWNESMLTPSQKEQVELGIKKVDDFKPKKQILGDKVNEYRLYDPQLIGDFTDCIVDTEMTEKEFEELIYQPVADEKLDEVIDKAKTKEQTKENEESENTTETPTVADDDLF